MPNNFGPPNALGHAMNAQTASAWGQGNLMANEQALAYRDTFALRAAGQQVPEQAWLAARTGFQRGVMPPVTGYKAEWSPGLPGSGIRGGEGLDLDAIGDAVAKEMFGVCPP